MKHGLLEFLACPACGASLVDDLKEPQGEEYMAGELSCSDDACRCRFPIVDGIPRLVVDYQEEGSAAETFGYEWAKHGEQELEGTTVFGRTQPQDLAYLKEATGIDEQGLRGAAILDAGCWSGQLTEGLGAEFQTRAVIGCDVNTAIEYPYRRCRHLPNVHIVQADIFKLPFKHGVFDVVWSNGVIHHTPDPPRAFVSLSGLVRRGGRLYVWVYERVWNPFRFTKDVFNALRLDRLPLSVVLRVVKLVTPPSYLLLSLYRMIRAIPGLRPTTVRGKNTVRYRSLKEIELTWFDALSPKYDFRYTEEDVKTWFRSQRFGNLTTYRHAVGVCGIRDD